MVQDWETEDLILPLFAAEYEQARLLIPITSFVCLTHLYYKPCKAGNISYKMFAKSFFTQEDFEFSKKGQACITVYTTGSTF